MAYASRTRISVDRTKQDIEVLLKRHGANKFAYYVEPCKAMIVFEAHERRLRFSLPLIEGENDRAHQVRRQQWRALLLCIKAKMESVSSKIETFEEAFLSHVILPDGKTVYEHSHTQIALAYKSGQMQPLLPDYSGGKRAT